MDRRLFTVLAWAALAAIGYSLPGCSKDKSPPPSAAAPATAKPDGASSQTASPDSAAPTSAPPELSNQASTPNTETSTASEQRELEQHRARSEEIRRRILDELDRSTVLGAFGSPNRQPGESPSPLAPADALDQNSLRTDASPPPLPVPAELTASNPLRQTKREPRIPATPASPARSPFSPPS